MSLETKITAFAVKTAEETKELKKIAKCVSSDLDYGLYSSKKIVNYAEDATVPASDGIVYNWNAAGDLKSWDNTAIDASHWSAIQSVITAIKNGTVIIATYSGQVTVKLCVNSKDEVCYISPDTMRWVTFTEGIMHTETVEPVTLPAGVILPFSGTVVPDGFLLCNGALVARAQYSSLFGAISTTFGAGDGSTTFALPNLTGRFLEGGSSIAYLAAGLPNITGYFGNIVVDDGSSQYSGGALYISGGNRTRSWGGASGDAMKRINFNAKNSNSIYGNSSTVQPLALQCLMIIKY